MTKLVDPKEQVVKESEIYFTIELPSKGLLYPKLFEVKSMRVKDYKKLASSQKGEYIKALVEVIKDLSKDPERVNDLTVQDFNYILTWLRVNSVSDIYNLMVTCPSCGNEIEERINLTKLESTEFKDEFKDPVVISVNDVKIKLALPRMADYVNFDEFPEEEFWVKMQASAIVSKKTFEEKIEFVNTAPLKVSRKLASFLEISDYGLDFSRNTVCNKNIKEKPEDADVICGQEVAYLLPFRSELFGPTGADEEDFREAICT